MRWAYIALFVVLVGAAVAQNLKLSKAESKAERKAARLELRQNKRNKKACKYDKKGARQKLCSERVADLLTDVSEANCPVSIPFPCNCKYGRRPAECSNPDTGTTTVHLKNGKREPNCPPTAEYPCTGCQYSDMKTAQCDSEGLMKPVTLLGPVPDGLKLCPAQVPCCFPKCPRKMKMGGGGKRGGRGKNGKRGKKGGNRRKAGRRGVACKYRQTAWSTCDPVSNMKTMVKTLKRGDPAACNTTQAVQKLCKRKLKAGVCRYRQTSWGACDPVTNVKAMVKTLKRGDPNSCPPTEIKEKICKRKHKGLKNNKCKYSRTEWSECDPITDMITMEMTLKKGDPSTCSPRNVITRKCKKKNKNGKTKIGKGCKYNQRQWGPCDAATNTVTVTMTLRQGDPAVCNATQIQVKKCKDKHLRPHVCKYRRSSWGDCDPASNMKQMVKILKRGDPAHCEPTQVVERKCKRKRAVSGKSSICKYRFEEWSECDIATNTMVRRQILHSGPSTCQEVKEYSRKCKNPCKFQKGTWSACDPETNLMTSYETVAKDSADFCGATRILTKKCGRKKKCHYDFGTWSDCDADTNKRTRTRTLVSGDDECATEKVSRKTCSKPNGEVRCFFGPWGDYESCTNGVQKKQRQVLAGGMECEKRGVKMIAC